MNYKSRIPTTIMTVLTRTVYRHFLICALSSLAIVASAGSATADEAIPVSIFDTFSQLATPTPGFDVSFAGKATLVIGTHALTATSRMDVKVTGDIVHCIYTYVIPGKGTLVLAAVCFSSRGHGAWHVKTGTRVFEHFKAIGTQEFGLLPAGQEFTNYERFAGAGTFTKHGDDHGDD